MEIDSTPGYINIAFSLYKMYSILSGCAFGRLFVVEVSSIRLGGDLGIQKFRCFWQSQVLIQHLVYWCGRSRRARELDIDRLGHVSAQGPGLFGFDPRLPGNGNGEHAYPKGDPLTPEERTAVIEFLKDPAPLPREEETG